MFYLYFCEAGISKNWIECNNFGTFESFKPQMIEYIKNKHNCAPQFVNTIELVTVDGLFVLDNGDLIKREINTVPGMFYTASESKTTRIGNFCVVQHENNNLEKLKIAKMLYRYPSFLKLIVDQEIWMCKLAIEADWRVLKYVKNQTPELCHLAIGIDSSAIKFVRDQTEEICERVINKYCRSIKYIKNQTPKLCELAVRQCVLALYDIRELTMECCKAAIDCDVNALTAIWNIEKYFPTELILHALAIDCRGTIKIIEHDIYRDGLSNDDYIQIIKAKPEALEFFRFPTPEICELAIELNPNVVKFANYSPKLGALPRYKKYKSCNKKGFEDTVEQDITK